MNEGFFQICCTLHSANAYFSKMPDIKGICPDVDRRVRQVFTACVIWLGIDIGATVTADVVDGCDRRKPKPLYLYIDDRYY